MRRKKGKGKRTASRAAQQIRKRKQRKQMFQTIPRTCWKRGKGKRRITKKKKKKKQKKRGAPLPTTTEGGGRGPKFPFAAP